MNLTPKLGTAALSAPRVHISHVNDAGTPSTPRHHTPSPPSPAVPSKILAPTYRHAWEVPSVDGSHRNVQRNCQLSVNSSSSTENIPISRDKTEFQGLASLGCSSGDTVRWLETKKQKLNATEKKDRPQSAFSWPHNTAAQAESSQNNFTTPKMPQRSENSGRLQANRDSFNRDSCTTRSSSEMPMPSRLNKAFQLSSSDSRPMLGKKLVVSENTLENSRDSTTPKETTPSSGPYQQMQLQTTGPPSSLSTQQTEDSITAKDITQARSKGRSRGIFSEEDLSSQAFLSVVWQAGKLAVAYYDVDLCQIFMMPDVQENDQFLLLKKVIDQVQPNCIVIGSKQDERLVKAVQLPDTTSDEGLSLNNDEYIQVLPSVDFSVDLCKRRILTVDLPTIPEHFSESDRTLHMSSLIPFENINMVRAVGGLLKFLDKKRIGIELEDSSCRVPILAFNIFTLKDMMLIDDNTYGALQIFHRESHPSVYKAGFSNATKEGLSLYGIMNRCRSQIGSKTLRLWFQRPTRDLEELKYRQDAIAFFCSPRNFEVTSTLMECVKNIKNISRILGRMTQSEISLSEWQALYKTVYNAIHVGDICRAQTSNVALLRKIGTKFTDDLHRIGSLISKIVDFEESAAQGRFVVKVGVDPELDQKKRTYNGLPDFLTRVARDELNKLSNDISECNIQYLPQLGYLLAVPETEELQARDNYKIETLEFMFMSNKMLHYKSESTKELDLILGDTHSEIADHETGIMHRLQNTILEHSAILLDVMQYAGELDCLLGLAIAAKEGNYVRPELLTEKAIRIKGGRHPLQELCVASFVPNDTLSDTKSGLMKILTGPNASGKSVYLKQVALIVFLAHIGSFVPAEEAHIGLTDAIYTRVRTLESVSVGLSTFMIDLNQVSAATRSATSSSLVLLDEFGKGTETEDGLALLCGCLKFWLEKKDGCPHVLVSTHFHSLVSRHLLPDSSLLKFQTMEVLRDDEGELVFLYQLVEGTTNTSYACHVATVAGIPKEIVTRGNEVSDLIRTNRPVSRIDSANNEKQYERCKSVVDQFLKFDLDKDNLQAFLHDVVLPACQLLK